MSRPVKPPAEPAPPPHGGVHVEVAKSSPVRVGDRCELEHRFTAFMAGFPGAEPVDSLLAGPDFDGRRRADYLLFDRRVIVELKSLYADPADKVQSELDELGERDDFPAFWGSVDVARLLGHLPDGEAILQRLHRRVLRSVEDAARSADAQIRGTAEALQIKGAVGMLVLLNQRIDILAPDIVVQKLSSMMCRTDREAEQGSAIDFAWLLFESHSVEEASLPQNFPLILLEGPRADELAWFADCFATLQQGWAAFNRWPLVEARAPFEELGIRPTAATPKATRAVAPTRQEVWEKRYAAHPYLRPLTDEQVLAYGHSAFRALEPYVIVGGPRVPLEQLEPLWRAWGAFLLEAEYRVLDLRALRQAGS